MAAGPAQADGAGPTAQAAQAVQGMQRLGRHQGHCALREHSREMHHPFSSLLGLNIFKSVEGSLEKKKLMRALSLARMFRTRQKQNQWWWLRRGR